MGLECTEDDMERLGGWTKECTFAKKACIMACCQNFAFTCEQAATFLGMIDFCGDDKLDILACFQDRIIDPDCDPDGHPILALFDGPFDEEKKTEAQELIASFTACEVGNMEEFEVEDDGIRSEEMMSELLDALEGEGFSDGKLEVLANDLAKEPSPPPFTPEQLMAVLGKFSFSGDREQALDFCTGPKLIYPMTCEAVVALIGEYSFADDKKSVLRKIKPFIKDAQNKLHIVISMVFAGDMEEAEEILRDVVVDFEDPVPPEEEIQAALRAIGTCPSGYAWVPAGDGYRCRAGGHYCSNAQIQAYLDSQSS